MKCILHLDVKENSYNAKPINSSHSILSGKSSSFNQSREDNGNTTNLNFFNRIFTTARPCEDVSLNNIRGKVYSKSKANLLKYNGPISRRNCSIVKEAKQKISKLVESVFIQRIPLTNLGKCWSFGEGLDNVEYGICKSNESDRDNGKSSIAKSYSEISDVFKRSSRIDCYNKQSEPKLPFIRGKLSSMINQKLNGWERSPRKQDECFPDDICIQNYINKYKHKQT